MVLPTKFPPVNASYQLTKEPAPIEVSADIGTIPVPQIIFDVVALIVGFDVILILIGLEK